MKLLVSDQEYNEFLVVTLLNTSDVKFGIVKYIME